MRGAFLQYSMFKVQGPRYSTVRHATPRHAHAQMCIVYGVWSMEYGSVEYGVWSRRKMSVDMDMDMNISVILDLKSKGFYI